jgi:CheY-like chemotaxis protein
MKKILVVNNDVETMMLLRDLLEKRTYQVFVTSGGRGSVQLARKLETPHHLH